MKVTNCRVHNYSSLSLSLLAATCHSARQFYFGFEQLYSVKLFLRYEKRNFFLSIETCTVKRYNFWVGGNKIKKKKNGKPNDNFSESISVWTMKAECNSFESFYAAPKMYDRAVNELNSNRLGWIIMNSLRHNYIISIFIITISFHHFE